MKQQIIENINNPENLERLYRENRQEFSESFAEIADGYNSELVGFWKVRLANENTTRSKGLLWVDLSVALAIALITGLLVKLPDFFEGIVDETFYIRNLAIVVFNGIIVYTLWQNRISGWKRLLAYGMTIVALIIYSNLLPHRDSDSINLVFIHLPLLLWCLFGLAFVSFDYRNKPKRVEFIRFNGELAVMTGLILIAGVLFSVVTVGLFSAINMNIEEVFMKNAAIFGGVAAPIISYCLIKIYPSITRKVAPVIARIFSPLVLITLAVYLVSMIFSPKSIMEDRNALMIFNVMLLAVVAIIVFSISELDKSRKKDRNVLVLLLLATLAIVTNLIALVAISARISHGLTPNRTVVLASNILILINLVLLARDLFLSYFRDKETERVEQTMAGYLNIYFYWTLVVIFILPFAFGFR